MNMVLVAIIIGLLYWFSCSELSIFSMPFQCPIIIGAICGLLYGDVETGIIIGAFLQAMYMGTFTAGNVLPSDKALASCIAIPIALATGLDATAAVAFAVPFGVLGAFVDTLRKTINSYWIRKADIYIEDANLSGLKFCAVYGPLLTQFVLRMIPVAIITYLGATFATPVVEAIPGWLMNGLSVAGGVLPAIGFVTCVLTIGRKELLAYFLIGFFLVKVVSMPVITTAIFAIAVAMLHVQFTNKDAQ